LLHAGLENHKYRRNGVTISLLNWNEMHSHQGKEDIVSEVSQMPKKICPACGAEMIETASGVNVCSKCKGVFLPASLIAIH